MDEINDIGNVIANTIDNKGEDKRNFFGILRAQRGATDLYNISGDSLNLLNEAYKSNKIGADEYKEGLRNIIEATGNDLGLNVSLVYLDTSTMPKDSEGSTGSAYIVDRKNRKVLIPIDVSKIGDINELFGTLTEEIAHGKDALEGRQDKKVAEDETNKEKGLETLGRPANEYVKKKFGEDNNSEISLTTDGIDLSNADVGEKVGDVITSEDRVFRTSYQSKYKYIQMDFDRAINGMLGLTGSVFRGGASYGLTSIGYSLAFAPEPFATKALGVGFMLGGLIAGAFTASDAVESAQDVYYGVTNQRDKKSVNFGRELLGEDTYDPLNTLSVAGMPILYDQANYTKVMVEGEAAKRAIATNMANQNQISNVTVGTNKSLNIKQREGQNPQQWQRSRDSLAQNNKNSINKTQPQGNQDYSGNQQVSKGATSNKQQGAPISKTSDINKSGVSQVAAPPSYLTKPEQGGTLVIAAGNNPIKGAHNIDINENIEIGVFKGDATNLVNVPTESQAKVIIENPDGFDPLNPEILRVVKEGGEIEITGIKSNKKFFNIYSGKVEVPKGFEIIEVGEIPENFQKQGFRTDGDLIGTKNGEGFPKKTDKIIRIRKIKK